MRCACAVTCCSFGVILWQMVSGVVPHEGMHPGALWLGVTTNSLHLAWPAHTHPHVQRLGEACMRFERGLRPSFTQVARRLGMIEDLVRVEGHVAQHAQHAPAAGPGSGPAHLPPYQFAAPSGAAAAPQFDLSAAQNPMAALPPLGPLSCERLSEPPVRRTTDSLPASGLLPGVMMRSTATSAAEAHQDAYVWGPASGAAQALGAPTTTTTTTGSQPPPSPALVGAGAGTGAGAVAGAGTGAVALLHNLPARPAAPAGVAQFAAAAEPAPKVAAAAYSAGAATASSALHAAHTGSGPSSTHLPSAAAAAAIGVTPHVNGPASAAATDRAGGPTEALPAMPAARPPERQPSDSVLGIIDRHAALNSSATRSMLMPSFADLLPTLPSTPMHLAAPAMHSSGSGLMMMGSMLGQHGSRGGGGGSPMSMFNTQADMEMVVGGVVGSAAGGEVAFDRLTAASSMGSAGMLSGGSPGTCSMLGTSGMEATMMGLVAFSSRGLSSCLPQPLPAVGSTEVAAGGAAHAPPDWSLNAAQPAAAVREPVFGSMLMGPAAQLMGPAAQLMPAVAHALRVDDPTAGLSVHRPMGREA